MHGNFRSGDIRYETFEQSPGKPPMNQAYNDSNVAHTKNQLQVVSDKE